MKEVTLGYRTSAFQQKHLYLLLTAIAGILLALMLILTLVNAHRLKEFQKTVPTADQVKPVNILLSANGTISFYAKDTYNLVILSEDTSVLALRNILVGGNVLNAVFMPQDTQKYQKVVTDILSQGIEIRHLYVPADTDKSFIAAFETTAKRGKIIPVKGKEYALFGDCAVYLEHGKGSLTFTIAHGNSSFLFSSKEKTGSLFSKKEADVCIMPYEALKESRLSTSYALFKESDFDTEKLASMTDAFLSGYHQHEIFCNSDGYELMFDIGFQATGRLAGE